MVKITWFLSFSGKNDAESLCHFVKIPFLDPKRAKLDQNSDFRHVRTSSWLHKSDFRHLRTLSWLHKLRNTQGKIHGTYLGNIYGIYKECITNISIDIYDITINIHQYIHQTHRRRLRRRPIGSVCLMDIFMDIYGYIINIYGYISSTFLIYSIYIS